MKALVIDIGGSSVKAAIVSRSGDDWSVVQRWPSAQVTVGTFAELQGIVQMAVARGLAADEHLCDVGISTTGSVNTAGVVLKGGFFRDYVDVSWDSILRPICSPQLRRIRVVNDGRAAAWGTFVADRFAAGKDLAHFVVGTGVGGGVAVGGRLLWGAHGLAGAFGHVKVASDTVVDCICGRSGCVEPRAAGPAVVRYAASMIATKSDEVLSAGTVFTIQELSEAARKGSSSARSAFTQAGEWLGKAIGSVVNVLDPEVVTIGGGVVEASRLTPDGSDNPYIEAARATALVWALPRISERIHIREASLHNDAALIGVAALALDASES